MNAAGRLALYGAGLVVAFGGAFTVAQAVTPDSAVQAWRDRSPASAHAEHEADDEGAAPTPPPGLSLSQAGYLLSPVSAPPRAQSPGQLRFRIDNAAGEPVTAFTTTHEKDLHLIAVRTDGSGFQHTHPTLDPATGIWSTPWTWPAAGSYRVFTDFQPADVGAAPQVTLSRTVQVAGEFTPVDPGTQRTVDQVDGYTVTLDGHLISGATGHLAVTVSRDGKPVGNLQPYLGAFGHLVALRDGDLAYLHVHPQGDEPAPGRTGGPTISFAAEAPTPGKYLLYLDFRVDGAVHTATFVIDAD